MKNYFSFLHTLESLPIIIWYIAIVIVSLPIIFPYFHPGFFPSHDGEWAVVRLSDMFRELKDLQFPARYSGNLDFGYGYPLFNFAYPFPYYLGMIFYFLKFGFVGSIKILFALTVSFSGVGMFLLTKKLWQQNIAAFSCSLLYLFLPYRMVDLYARGSIGESFAFALYPFLLYFALQLRSGKKVIYGILFSICLAILITSHNIMAVYFMPILFVIFLALFFENKKNAYSLVSYSILGVLLSTFFWLPALYESQYIQLAKIPIADRNINYVLPWQFIIPKIGYGLPNDADGFSYQLGVSQLIILLITLLIFLFRLSKQKFSAKHFTTNLVGFFLVLCLINIFLLFSVSNFFWQHIPLYSTINYPWTQLLPIGFLVTCLSGYIYTKKYFGQYIVIILSLLAIIMYLSYAKPQYYVNRGEGFYFTNDATTTSSSEYTPLWVKVKPTTRANQKIISLNSKSSFSSLVYNSKKITFNDSSSADDTIRINTIYYPGWKFLVDGKQVPISYNNQTGVMDIAVTSGTHFVTGTFSETPLRFISDIISLLSCLFVVIIFGKIFLFKK